MKEDDIIRMAQEADLGVYLAPQWQLYEQLERFAALVAAAEREACADLCYQLVDNSRETRFATAIRARGNT